MIYVSLRDGSVRRYDLGTVEGREDWTADSVDPRWADSVRAIALGSSGSRVDLPRPRRFDRVVYRAESIDRDGVPVAERLTAVCGDVVVSLTLALGEREGRVRVDLDRRGTARFIPR